MLDEFPDDDQPTRRSARAADDRPRWGRRVLIVLASFVALVLVAVAGFYVFLDRKAAGNITQENLLPQTTPSVDGKPVPLEGVGKNYLIVGADTRPGDAGRSDVIVLAHVPEDKSSVYPPTSRVTSTSTFPVARRTRSTQPSPTAARRCSSRRSRTSSA